MPKPSQFRFVPADQVIWRVAWWGERLMATVIAATLVSVKATTDVPDLIELAEWIQYVTFAAAVVYVGLLATIVARPSRVAHAWALPFGLFLFTFRAFQFVELASKTGMGGIGNIAERVMLAATVVVYHTWGIWSDRRDHS